MLEYVNVNEASFSIENELLSQNYKVIAGIDEAGRGALAGPLSVGLVIYSNSFINNPSKQILTNIRDSKKLSPKKRVKALQFIKDNSLYFNTAIISHQIVDSLNVNGATEFAVKKLVNEAEPRPDIIIMDGNFSFNVGIPILSVIKGDLKSISIASSSIVAKVMRDSLMKEFELEYPGYYFNKNMGYGTLQHRNAINKFGHCHIHRRTYEPVKGIIGD